MIEIHDNRILASFASFSSQSKGRLFSEDDNDIRTAFQRDRDRILHSSAFRRLKHKTQVFMDEEGDYHRTRLTHTIEVAQIARSIAYALKVNEDLTEAIALAHDLGHPPFGHAGEEELNRKMIKFGGFDHNDHCLRIITKLEKKYIKFSGLNLSWETIEGIAKHNGIVEKPSLTIDYLDKKLNLNLGLNTCLEGQIAAVSDDIAYISHDFDDGLKSGLLSIDQVKLLPRVGKHIGNIIKKTPSLSNNLLIHEMIRSFMTELVDDILKETRKNLYHFNPISKKDITNFKYKIVKFSDSMYTDLKSLRLFLNSQMWRHKKVEGYRIIAKKIIKDLFNFYYSNPKELSSVVSDNGLEVILSKDEIKYARMVSDYIASMTDRHARFEHEKYFFEFYN